MAYRQFLQQLPTFLRGTRFTKRNFGAVLQHYGFRTPWLDVVDDLHAAIWFALNDFDKVDSKCVYRPTGREYGWIAVIDVPSAGHVLNLREAQSSRNTRCNVQQGYSLAMQYDDARAPSAEQDFMANVVCMVRIPNGERWRLLGFRGSSDYFFPPPAHDDTYCQLLDTKVATIASAMEKTHGLRDEALGRVNTYH